MDPSDTGYHSAADKTLINKSRKVYFHQLFSLAYSACTAYSAFTAYIAFTVAYVPTYIATLLFRVHYNGLMLFSAKCGVTG